MVGQSRSKSPGNFEKKKFLKKVDKTKDGRQRANWATVKIEPQRSTLKLFNDVKKKKERHTKNEEARQVNINEKTKIKVTIFFLAGFYVRRRLPAEVVCGDQREPTSQTVERSARINVFIFLIFFFRENIREKIVESYSVCPAWP